jgi:2-amino-4-hydroxy-6-hydroxymethyldihydropteridine diphosphokinase
MKHIGFIALGTNIGDRLANINKAIESLSPEVNIIDRSNISNIYETPPWGYLEQPAFLNQVVEVRTSLSPLALLDYLKEIESNMGRLPNILNGPRLIDLDIIFFDDLVIKTRKLTIPHPRLEGRAFVLVPLSDLAPDYRHPYLGKSVKELLQEADQSGISIYKENSQ